VTDDPAPPAPPDDPAPPAPPDDSARPAPPAPPADPPYRPGVCNIGPDEIARRRRAAVATAVLAVVVAGGVLLTDLPQLARLVVFPFAAAAGVSWLQVVRGFCVAFGAAGVLTFGALGSTQNVADAQARAADRRTALRMTLEGGAYGLLVTLGFWVLPA